MALERNDLMNQEMPLPAYLGTDSPGCHWHRIAGRITFCAKNFAPAGAANFFEPIFRIHGLIEMKAIYATFTAAANPGANGPSHCYLIEHANVTNNNITSGTPGVGGVDCTNAIIGASVAKMDALAQPLIYLDAATCAIRELTVGGPTRPFFSSLLQADPAFNTDIYFQYTVINGAMTFSMLWAMVWACRYQNSYVEAI